MTGTVAPSVEQAETQGTLRLPQATALIMGSIVGTGIFTLPASLAGFGPIAIVAFGVVTIGALALALMFGSLSKRTPADGGPYAYAREAFGDFAGFTNAWSYWITAWAGNAAIVVSWVLYVQALFGWDSTNVALSVGIALFGLWLPAMVNMTGVGSMGAFQLVTTVIKFVPLVIISTIGLFYIDPANFGPFNISGEGAFKAISSAGALALFSYLGVETAAVAAGKVRDPERNVPRATVYGTLACSAVYLLSTIAIFGIVGPAALQESLNPGAPFIDAFDAMFGGSWAGKAVAAAAVVSGLGALNGWTMICAEMPYAAAREGLFPKIFASVTSRNVPWFGIIGSTVLASIFTYFAYQGESGLNVFNTLVFLSGVTAAIPYFFSALAQLYWLFTDGRRIQAGRFARDSAIAGVSLVFSTWFVYGSGSDATFWAFLMLLLGWVVYLYLRIKTGKYGTAPAEGL
jgi:basic amino acid/polyamine antiporter, APA family